MFTAGTCEEYPNKRSLNNPKLILSQAGNAQVSASGRWKVYGYVQIYLEFQQEEEEEEKEHF